MLELFGRLCTPTSARRQSRAQSSRQNRTAENGARFQARREQAARWRYDGPCRFRVVAATNGGGGGGAAAAAAVARRRGRLTAQ